jgi:hypothetical protein
LFFTFSTDAELKSVTREINEARSKIEKFVSLRAQLEDDLFLLSQEQLTSDKSAQNAYKTIQVTNPNIGSGGTFAKHLAQFYLTFRRLLTFLT